MCRQRQKRSLCRCPFVFCIFVDLELSEVLEDVSKNLSNCGSSFWVGLYSLRGLEYAKCTFVYNTEKKMTRSVFAKACLKQSRIYAVLLRNQTNTPFDIKFLSIQTTPVLGFVVLIWIRISGACGKISTMTNTNTDVTPLIQGRFVDPATVATHFYIKEGDTVADFGVGSGYFVEVLAKLVGDEGVVYACDIQKMMVEKVGTLARTKGLSQVVPLWGDIEEPEGSKIPDGVLDVAIVVNTFFQFEEKNTALEEIYRTLRSGGKLFIIDWSESFGGLGPQPEQVISEQEVKDLAEQEKFVFERSFDSGDHHYGLGFRKP